MNLMTHSEDSGYNEIHGYITTPICILGIIFNILSAVGWSRVPQKTAVNFVLRLLSIVDLFVALSYLVIAIFVFVLHGYRSEYCNSKAAMYLILISNHLFILTSAWSNWTALSLAIIRFINVLRKRNCPLPKVKKIVCVCVVLFLLESIIYFFYYKVEKAPHNLCGYWLHKTKMAATNENYQTAVYTMLFLTRGIVPTVMFVVLCTLTLYIVIKNRNSDRLFNTYAENNRVTAMLLFVGVMFFVTMIPVTLYPLTMFLRPMKKIHYFWFLDDQYQHFNVNMLSLPQLCNCSFNIFVYIAMNPHFRRSICGSRHRAGYENLEGGQIQNPRRIQVAVKNFLF